MYLEMGIAGALGIVLQILIKVRAINNRKANETFKTVFIAYFKKDIINPIISVVVVSTAIFLSNEWLKENILGYEVSNFINTAFFFVGYSANSVVTAFLGKTEKNLEDKINK